MAAALGTLSFLTCDVHNGHGAPVFETFAFECETWSGDVDAGRDFFAFVCRLVLEVLRMGWDLSEDWRPCRQLLQNGFTKQHSCASLWSEGDSPRLSAALALTLRALRAHWTTRGRPLRAPRHGFLALKQ